MSNIQQTLVWYAEAPYLASWNGQTMSVKVADSDFVGAPPWSRDVDPEMVDDLGLEVVAGQMVAWHHVAAAGAGRL